MKTARKWGYKVKGIPEGKAEIIACANNFHGRTITIVSFSTDEQYRDGFGPFTPGFRIVPYGDAKAVADAITPNTCAFIVEPIQGEAGIVVPPAGFLRETCEACKKNNVLFVADEIQSGLGRTGKLFAFEHEGIRPDMVIIGKALSGGFYPVSAVLASKEVLGVFKPGDHGSTFGGNPLACAIARAALQVLVDEKMVERSAELGAYFLERLQEHQEPEHQGGPRHGPVDWHGDDGPRPPLLRGAEGRGDPLQGNPRARHPLRAAARHHEGRDRLGGGEDREGRSVSLTKDSGFRIRDSGPV